MNRFQQALEERIRMASSHMTESAYKIVKTLYEQYHVEPLKEFYNWYLEANAATRAQVLNRLQKALGLKVEEYPNRMEYIEEYLIHLTGKRKDELRKGYKKFLKDSLQEIDQQISNLENVQGKLDIKDKAPKGELDL